MTCLLALACQNTRGGRQVTLVGSGALSVPGLLEGGRARQKVQRFWLRSGLGTQNAFGLRMEITFGVRAVPRRNSVSHVLGPDFGCMEPAGWRRKVETWRVGPLHIGAGLGTLAAQSGSMHGVPSTRGACNHMTWGGPHGTRRQAPFELPSGHCMPQPALNSAQTTGCATEPLGEAPPTSVSDKGSPSKGRQNRCRGACVWPPVGCRQPKSCTIHYSPDKSIKHMPAACFRACPLEKVLHSGPH